MKRPRLRVAGADVDEFGVRVVGHAVPHRAAAASCPPVRVPGGRSFFQRRALERLRWIARNGVEAPGATAGQRVVGVEKSARRTVAAADADDHLPLDRKSTRLNSSHSQISYAVFCLKKK